MLLTTPVVVLTVVALLVQRIERLIFYLPPRSTTAHELIDVPRTAPQVRHPTAVLPLVLTALPLLDAIDSHVRARGIERHVMDKAQARPKTCSTVMAFIRGPAPGVLRRLHLLEQQGMIALFAPEERVQSGVVSGRDMRGLGTQPVCGDDALEVWVVWAQLGDDPFGGMAFAIIFACPLLFDERFRPQRKHCTDVGMKDRRA